MKNRIVSLELLNKILSYLGTKPYIEVVGLVKEIMELPEVKTEVKIGEGMETKDEKLEKK